MERTGSLVALAVVDALLVLTVVLLAVRPMSGALPAVPPAGSASTGATPTSGAPAAFRLPSGNISCDLSDAGATCTISDFTYTPKNAARCTGGAGHVVAVDAAGVSTPCQKGPAPTVSAQVSVLGYGTSRTVGDYTCLSAQSGVQCTRADGAGFRLSRSALVVLP
jgi:hypothetical protein